MAILKALGLSSAAAAIATAAIASSSSCSPLPPRSLHTRRNLQGEFRAHQKSSSRFGLPRQSNPFYSVAMAIGGSVTADEKASAPEILAERGQNGTPPDVLTEFMVDMKCEGCVSSVRKKLEPLEGVKGVDVDLPNQVVRVQGTASLKALYEALEQTGRKARLIGQGTLDYFQNAATVAEFKGPDIYGVVRIVQVSMELARIEANFSGLSQGPHGWSINEYGDLTRGAASTGGIYNPSSCSHSMMSSEPVGDLGVLVVDATGKAEYSGSKPMLKVADLPGRALVVYGTEDKSEPGIAAAVIARSAGVGENYKKLCTCDGTLIWESTNNDFVKVESRL